MQSWGGGGGGGVTLSDGGGCGWVGGCASASVGIIIQVAYQYHLHAVLRPTVAERE